MTAFSQAFEAWEATACVADFPYASVLALYHKLGKHFVPEPVTDCLIRAREAHVPAGGAPRLSAFLDCMLDKSDDRYDYASYCALELLELPCGDPVALTLDEIARERDMALLALLGDLVGFEWRALQGQESRLPQMRPDAALASKRVQRVLAAMRPSLLRLGCSSHALPGKIDVQGFLDWRQAVLPDECRTRMALSILPVHVVHDEYLFLRTLQAFEANFAWIAVLLRGALHALERDGESALESLEQANGYLRETARLFPLLGTMQIAAFHDFRRFTEGASAIQSAGYKKVEALCRRPDEERLNSIAYAAVPGIRDAVQNGQPTLEEVYARACARRHLSVAVLGKIEAQMGLFASQLLRWRQAHLQLARRFLGERGGTGYTEGVPYLASVKDIPVFRTVPARS
ncbi:Tryptophan 2,3-dioxygenase (vermilion) [Aliiruegeria lutimaris]|uniref:Tryptophan 2,3-dioxygenase (Vermilion) n=2 Tax=Aliiruegeria lutimaris TaxID=571298 RepID=A0A1G9BLK6_9RHOB|nr:Tryptophan 2,3-dioxygenase (vermilion) [Aliiruegeria lutimaris]